MKYINKLGSTKRKIYFSLVKQKLRIKNAFYQNKKHTYLFILSPPFSGSTLLNEIISSSNNVSCNNNIGLREGQHLPETKDILFTPDRWEPNKIIDWSEIHEIWRAYWDNSKSVFLEKSPPNICRAKNIENEFSDAKFICLVRNPYAQVEGKMRRYNTGAKEAALLSIKYLQFQRKNYKELNNALLIKYEDLTENPNNIKEQIISFINELNDINININITAHNSRNEKRMKITNLNDEKITKIKKEDLTNINSIFMKEKELLEFFGYSLIKL